MPNNNQNNNNNNNAYAIAAVAAQPNGMLGSFNGNVTVAPMRNAVSAVVTANGGAVNHLGANGAYVNNSVAASLASQQRVGNNGLAQAVNGNMQLQPATIGFNNGTVNNGMQVARPLSGIIQQQPVSSAAAAAAAAAANKKRGSSANQSALDDNKAKRRKN